MAATVGTPLGPNYYSRGLGPVFAIMLDTGIGVRLGDAETLRVTTTEEEGAEIVANDYSEPTVVDTQPGTKRTEVELVLKQLSDTARAASLMGEQGNLAQEAVQGMTFKTTGPGVYHVETFDMQDLVVTKANGGGVAVEGEDYTVDRRMGVLEERPGAGDLDWLWDQPAIPTRFITGIASGAGIRCRIVFPGINSKGKRAGAIVRDVLLKPSAGRDFISTEIAKISLKGLAKPVTGAGIRPGTEVGYEIDLPAIEA